MNSNFSTKHLVAFSIFATLLLFAFSGSHPTTGSGGYTGAPGDNVCTTCHTPGGSLDGTIEIGGLPSTVTPNQTYPLTITITNTAGSADRAGFQMVSLKSNLANGGTFSVPTSENNAQVKTAGGKSYVGHEPAKDFVANTVTYDVEWTAPATATGDITVYAAAIIANGANGNSGDKFAASTMPVTLGSGGNPLTVTFSNIVDASCSDSNDGSATINATGGSGNYSYNWDNGEMNATAVMLSPGLHTITVTDDSNEEIVESVTIGAPAPITPFIDFQNDAICNGESTGEAEVSATGGTPSYFFNWGNGINGAIQNSLIAGNYTVTVSDLNGCQEFIDVMIGEPDPIVINVITLDEPTCNGDDDGTIAVEATGGNGNFTYNWIDGIGVSNQGTLSLIPSGDYQVEVIDALGCTNQTTITLVEPDVVTSTINGIDILCFGDATGSATAQGEGGTGTFSYEWSNGGIGETQSGLTTGTYFVTVSDSDNCTSVSSIEIFEPSSALEANVTVINQPNCGNQDGELSAFGLGGTPGYSYVWNTGDNGAVLTNISAGEYIVTVTDLNNCTSVDTVILEDNDGITLAANNVGNNTCPDGIEGTATISASGGTGAYSYSWSNGGMNATENNLPAGEYSITVSDEGNCTGEISIEITEPDAFASNEIQMNISCNGAEDGTIQLNATGGTGALTYAWNNGETTETINDLVSGVYIVTITDANSCTEEIEFVITEPEAIVSGDIMSGAPSCPGEMDGFLSIDPSGGTGNLSYLWSNGDTTSMTENLGAGDYAVSVTDENDCEGVFQFTLDEAVAIEIIATTTPPTCNDGQDGSATLSLSGGSGNYKINWSTGDTTMTLENLAGGSYFVNVSSGNCAVDTSIFIPTPLAIDPNITSTNETSNGAVDGTAMADPQNGTAPYSYIWSTGDTTQSIQNLGPGSYDLTITDTNNCMATGTAIVNNGDCDMTSNVDLLDISCFGLMDGAISVELEGAVSPIMYQWSNGAVESSLTGLGEGTYNVTITDANNCQIQLTDLVITEPEEIMATGAIIMDASNPASSDGSIDIAFSGGTGQLEIEYEDENGIPLDITSLENLTAGFYAVIVTDENGCIKTFGPFEVGVLSTIDEENSIIVHVYPNPANTFFKVATETTLSMDPKIYTISGQLVQTNFTRNQDVYKFEANQLPNGVYYIKLVSQSNIVLKKILVTK